MKVGELINELKEYPEDMEIVIDNYTADGGSYYSTNIILNKAEDLVDEEEGKAALKAADAKKCLVIY